jgi:hypothetical protein
MTIAVLRIRVKRRSIPVHQAGEPTFGASWSLSVRPYYQAGLFRGFQRLDRASGSHERALSIWRELDNRVKEGLTLSTLGAVYGSLKQNEKAIDRFN